MRELCRALATVDGLSALRQVLMGNEEVASVDESNEQVESVDEILSRNAAARLEDDPRPPRVLGDAELLQLVAARSMNWRGFNLAGAALWGIDVNGEEGRTNLDLTRLDDANLQHSRFRHLPADPMMTGQFQVAHAEWNRVALKHAQIVGFRFLGCHFSSAAFMGAVLIRTTFSGCMLPGATFADTVFGHVTFEGPGRLIGAQFNRVETMLAGPVPAPLLRFVDQDLSRAYFEACRMPGTDFRGSNLEGSRFVDCDLRRADFRQTNFGSASFSNCNLDGALH
jgi:uncharacterized protein YjbI with pentapeptide repeats